MQNRVSRVVCLSFLVWACGSTEPRVQPCAPENSVAVGAIPLAIYSSITPSTDGCVLFSANPGTDTIEFVVVAQSGATDPNRQVQFRLAGDASLMAPAAIASANLLASPKPSVAARFDAHLRAMEARQSYKTARTSGMAELNLTQPPPFVGEVRSFKVCSSLTCPANMMTSVSSIAKAVGDHVALFVDQTAQSSLTQADYDEMVTEFDERLFPVDTLAFGQPSDRDGNGMVIALMTPAINRLVSDSLCREDGFVAGYFFGADIDPAADLNPNYNKAELFYALVPDPNGQYSCPHTVERVRDLVPSVFVHELQHMISFNYHVILPEVSSLNTEVLWLNEALSHYAEELGGRTYMGSDPAKFSAYLSGNIRNAYDYLSNTGGHFLVANFGSGTLGERGAGWLFIRYLVDQMTADTGQVAWGAVTRQLTQNTLVGPANVESVTGAPFDQTLARWALALWVSDLPGFTAPPELRYRSWAFRTTYGALHPNPFPRPYPLEPTVALGPNVDFAGTLRSGSAGTYQRVLHPPGAAPFTLQMADVNGIALHRSLAPRITVIRVR